MSWGKWGEVPHIHREKARQYEGLTEEQAQIARYVRSKLRHIKRQADRNLLRYREYRANFKVAASRSDLVYDQKLFTDVTNNVFRAERIPLKVDSIHVNPAGFARIFFVSRPSDHPDH